MDPSPGSRDGMNKEFQSTSSPFLALSLQKLTTHVFMNLCCALLCPWGYMLIVCRPASEAGEVVWSSRWLPHQSSHLCQDYLKPSSIKNNPLGTFSLIWFISESHAEEQPDGPQGQQGHEAGQEIPSVKVEQKPPQGLLQPGQVIWLCPRSDKHER